MSLLDEIEQRVHAEVRQGRVPILIFDIDSTLISTKPRNAAIAREFAELGAELHPAVSELSTCEAREMGWLVSDALRARGCDAPEVLDALMAHWFRRFFSGDILVHDVEVPGAVAFVQAMHEAGALIYYLTGRDAPVMGAGTVQSMHGLGFPMFRGRVVLHLKPNRSVGDKAYKRGALADVRSHRGPVVATFENDPGNANIFAEGFPEAIHVWMQTEWAPDAEEPSEVLRRLGDFRRD